MGFGTEIIFAFGYDAVSNTFRPADLSDKPPQGHDAKCGYVCQTMAQKRDYVCHGIRDEVRTAKPTRLTTSISNCSSNEPDKRFGGTNVNSNHAPCRKPLRRLRNWLDELELMYASPRSTHRNWRTITIAASVRLATRLNVELYHQRSLS